MVLDRITFNPEVMGGKPCVRDTRVPVSVVLKLLAGGTSREDILADYPYLESEDINQCMCYAVSLVDERIVVNTK